VLIGKEEVRNEKPASYKEKQSPGRWRSFWWCFADVAVPLCEHLTENVSASRKNPVNLSWQP